MSRVDATTAGVARISPAFGMQCRRIAQYERADERCASRGRPALVMLMRHGRWKTKACLHPGADTSCQKKQENIPPARGNGPFDAKTDIRADI